MWRGLLILLVIGAFAAAPPAALATFPGGNGLLVVGRVTGSGIQLVNSHTGAERTICVGQSACAPRGTARWSPDGNELAVSAGEGIAILYPDGSCLDCQPFGHWRPTFTSTPGYLTAITNGQLNRYAVDGLLHSTLLKKNIADAAWSAANRLAIVRSGRIWVGTPQKLRSLGRGSQPSWSPNGREIAAVRGRWIVLLGVARRSVVRLVRGSSPAFSPDGRSLAFIGRRHRLSVIRLGRRTRAHTIGRVVGDSVDWEPLPANSQAPCAVPPGMQLMASSTSATIIGDKATPPGDHDGPQNAVLECLKQAGRLRLVIRNAAQGVSYGYSVDAASISGRYFALLTDFDDGKYAREYRSVQVYDVATGSRIYQLGGEGNECDGEGCWSEADGLVINDQGYTALHTTYIVYGQCQTCPGTSTEQVLADDSAGVHTLDTATTSIEGGTPGPPVITSLALNDDTLTWDHGGQPESATLH